MKVRERTATLSAAELDVVLAPRRGAVHEAAHPDGGYLAISGPFEHYRRTIEVDPPDADGAHVVRQRVEIGVAIPFWRWMFGPPLVRTLARIGNGDTVPWWFPPDTLDKRASTTLSQLGALSCVLGYGATLLTQTITYAAADFGQGKAAQGVALAAVRADVLIAVPLALMADRRGRRALIVRGSAAACALTALGAFAPNMWFLGAAQVLARGVTSAAIVTLGVMVAEEMPAGARAWATSLMAMAGFLGGGVCVVALPLADLRFHLPLVHSVFQGWRLMFLVPLAAVPLTQRAGRTLTESRRFVARQERTAGSSTPSRSMSGHGRRFWLLAASGALLAVFATPAAQFQNEFLRVNRGFSGAQIAFFIVLTSLPGAVGIVVGGRLAERGRRLVGAFAVFAGVGTTVAMFHSAGVGLYAWSAVGSLVGAAAIPALGVYGPELFPTGARGTANGAIGVVSRAGSVVGLVAAGFMADRIGLPAALTWLAIGPAILTVLILLAYPETAHRELEELNPEDAVP